MYLDDGAGSGRREQDHHRRGHRGGEGGSGIVPYLPLDQLRGTGQGGATPPVPTAGQGAGQTTGTQAGTQPGTTTTSGGTN